MKTMRTWLRADRLGWAIFGALGAAIILVASGVVGAGPLDPPGPVGSTMKTLDQIEPRTPISSIPYTITQPGSYYLTADLSAATADSAITIDADNVTLDLGGHTLDGANIGGSAISVAAVNPPHASVTVRNGNVRRWTSYGISMVPLSSGVLEDVTSSHNNFSGMYLYNVRASGCVSASNAGVGVYAVYSVLDDCTATGNTDGFNLSVSISHGARAEDNSGHGIKTNGGAISGCVVTDNGGAGVYAERATVEGCAATGNNVGIESVTANNILRNIVAGSGEQGILVSDNGSLISGNTVSASGQFSANALGSGIHVSGANNRISGNSVARNGGGGIWISGNFNTLDDNSALENINVGIRMDDGVIKNTVVRNSAVGNYQIPNSINYLFVAGNNLGPVNIADTASNPWANTQ